MLPPAFTVVTPVPRIHPEFQLRVPVTVTVPEPVKLPPKIRLRFGTVNELVRKSAFPPETHVSELPTPSTGPEKVAPLPTVVVPPTLYVPVRLVWLPLNWTWPGPVTLEDGRRLRVAVSGP